MYWQYGDILSYDATNDDGYAMYYGSADFEPYVVDHIAAIANSTSV